MRITVIVSVLGVVCGLAGAAAADPAPTAAETELTAIRARLPYLPTGDFLCRRKPREFGTGDGSMEVWQALERLETTTTTVAELETLTRHDHADLRALALLGLAAKETPAVVPASLRLMNDSAGTLPALTFAGGRLPGDTTVHTEPQTVRDIARTVLRMVDCPFGDGAKATDAEAAAWWAARDGNRDWLGWYGFLYKRASRYMSPVPPEAKEPIRRFRALVDTLPPATRAWTLLYLADDVFMSRGLWEDHYATEAEMTDAVKALGGDALVGFLRDGSRRGLRQPKLDLPGHGDRFVVTYAARFFEPRHADELMRLGQFTAAADADPGRVRSIAREGMSQRAGGGAAWDRAGIMAALAALGDSADRATAVAWFYAEPNASSGSSPQSIFIHALQRRRPDTWRDTARRLIERPEFDQLKPLDVIYLMLLVEELGKAGKLAEAHDSKAGTARLRLREWAKTP